MDNKNFDIPIPKKSNLEMSERQLSQEEVYDKILGGIVGSAIGDAMGASTEMWDRDAIKASFGYITGLTQVIREKSPEGTWQHNMLSGATTDDTRWKYFLGQYLGAHQNDLSGKNLAAFVVDYYKDSVKGLQKEEIQQSTDALDQEMEKVNWIKEWARVSMAYEKGEPAYAIAQNRFYGGEMSCAGMLYSPMFGLIASDSKDAYLMAFEHGLFDIGYARDITALTSTLTYNAMYYSEMDSILNLSVMVDPHSYRDSRLIGRLATDMASEARGWVTEEIEFPQLEEGEDLPPPPEAFPGSSEDWYRQNVIYERMALKQKAIAFHAGEIWQILIAGLEFGVGDFLRTMQFIVNYGRDNDTVAAVAGNILGAKIGYSDLPAEIRDEVVKVSRELMGMDLEELAREIMKTFYEKKNKSL